MLIVFEGINGSGKTELSREVARKLDCHWTKEPRFFTSEEAHAENACMSDEFAREARFLKDRLMHQSEIRKDPSRVVICDRYIWSGLAYSLVYSKSCTPLLSAIYSDPELFVQPDLYIYLATPVRDCTKRRPDLHFGDLVRIADAYGSSHRRFLQKSKVVILENPERTGWLDKLGLTACTIIESLVKGA